MTLKQNAIFLGVDPGLATTGYGIVVKRNGVLFAKEWGVIATKPNLSNPERLTVLYDDLYKLLRKHRPHLAVVESLYFAKNLKTAITVSQARGVILFALQKAGVNILELTPLQMKSQITGYGAAPKAQVQRMVVKLLKLKQPPRPDDAADALALALCVGHNR